MQKAHLHLKDPLGKPSHFTVILSVLLYFFPSGLWAAMAATSLTAHFYGTRCCDLDLNQSGRRQRARGAEHQISPKVIWADQKIWLSGEKQEPTVHLGELWECGLAGGDRDGTTTGKGPPVTTCIPRRQGTGIRGQREICNAVKVGCPFPPLPSMNFKNILLAITEGIPSSITAQNEKGKW